MKIPIIWHRQMPSSDAKIELMSGSVFWRLFLRDYHRLWLNSVERSCQIVSNRLADSHAVLNTLHVYFAIRVAFRWRDNGGPLKWCVCAGRSSGLWFEDERFMKLYKGDF